MMAKVKKWGNSQGLHFTKTILKEAHINVGDEVNITVHAGKIIVEPAKKLKRKYDIKELVSKMPENYHTQEIDWGTPVGKEEW